MITLLILTALLILIIGILLVPIRIVIDTNRKQYYVSLPGYLRADLLFTKDRPLKIRMRIFFISFMIKPSQRYSRKEEVRVWKEKKSVKNPLTLFINLLKSIKIKYCYANIDTGDFPLNAQLIPAAQIISGKNINININFENRNDIKLMLQTRGIKLIRVYIKHKLLNK